MSIFVCVHLYVAVVGRGRDDLNLVFHECIARKRAETGISEGDAPGNAPLGLRMGEDLLRAYIGSIDEDDEDS